MKARSQHPIDRVVAHSWVWLFVAFFVSEAPAPWGWTLIWTLVALQAAAAAWVSRRAGLHYHCVAFAYLATVLGSVGLYAWFGNSILDLGAAGATVFWSSPIVAFGLAYLDRRANAEAWQAWWTARTEEEDMTLFPAHIIPDLGNDSDSESRS